MTNTLTTQELNAVATAVQWAGHFATLAGDCKPGGPAFSSIAAATAVLERIGARVPHSGATRATIDATLAEKPAIARPSFYDHTCEGTPVPDRAPAKVRTTKPLHDVRELAPGLYAGRSNLDELLIIDADWHRGYVTRWPTPAKPDGWRVHTWAGDRKLNDRREVRRVYPDRVAAERALIREVRKLAAPALAIAA